MSYTCEICMKSFKSMCSFNKHILCHSMSIKEYYDKYIDKEHICECCKVKPAIFKGLIKRLWQILFIGMQTKELAFSSNKNYQKQI